MGGSDQWALQAPLAERRDLITIDLPGFGKNAHMPPINTIRGFAEWVLAEIVPQEFDLLGHSMGGMIVQEMARLAPDRVCKLVLYGTGATGELPGRFESIETSMQRARTEGARHTACRIAATWFLKRESAPEYPACAAIAERAKLTAIVAGLEAMRGWSGIDHLAHRTRAGDCRVQATGECAPLVAIGVCRLYIALMADRYAKNAGAVFTLKYHLVWCPKYRRKVLTGQIGVRLRQLLAEVADEKGMTFHAMEIMPDHVHLFVESDPTLCVAEIVNRLKGRSSRVLRQEFPTLRSRLPTLWSRSYYAGTVGHVSQATVKRYIENQKGK